MNEQIYRNPMNVILEGYQPIESGNFDPKRPPRGRSGVVPRPGSRSAQPKPADKK